VLAEEEEKTWEKRNIFSLDLTAATESPLRTTVMHNVECGYEDFCESVKYFLLTKLV